ncbi:MAG: hypothetical protein LBS88_05670 [Tannerellaceae bacterium]|nr:hypothetical protein [Tannerellaceae bacterium]
MTQLSLRPCEVRSNPGCPQSGLLRTSQGRSFKHADYHATNDDPPVIASEAKQFI